MAKSDFRPRDEHRIHLTSWDFFCLRHRKTPNLVVHFLTWILYLVSFYFILVHRQWTWFLGVFASGAIAAPSHYLFDDGGVNLREATWDPLVPFFVTIMFLRMARGLYFEDVEKALAKVEELRAQGVLE